MAIRRAQLGAQNQGRWFLYRKGDRVEWNGEEGTVVDGWCEYEESGGAYLVTYVVERAVGMRFNATELKLVRIGSHPNSIYVRRYLESAFPGATVEDGERVPRDAYWFRVKNEETAEKYHAAVSQEFLDDTPVDQVEHLLAAWDLAGEMRRTPNDYVLVGETDCKRRISLAEF